MQPEITNPTNSVTIPTEILLSLATAPMLVGILASKASLELMQAIGKASEEVFRGASLPILDFPDIDDK